ncbi:MAG: ATP-binding protein [Deltaproteobacteria bacterium]|nr:ATP-binding protein [Deltaproteobacteria bacterium]
MKNTVDKIIHSDIPHFLPEVRESHLNLMRHIIGYLATSPIPTLNIDNLAKTWSVGKLTVYNLLAVMEDTSLIQIIRHEGLKKGKSKGGKIFFADPSLYAAFHGQLGNIREAYFCMQMRKLGLTPECPKDDSQYDFKAGNKTFEIGGRSKKAKQADFVIRDDIDMPSGRVIPLWYLEFLKL